MRCGFPSASTQPCENDSKDFYDRAGIEADVFEHDWAKCWEKQRFQKLVNKNVGGEDLKAELRKRYGDLLRIFDFVCISGSGDIFSMQKVEWGMFLLNSHVTFEGSTRLKAADCDLVFKATNFEEDRASEVSMLNQDKGLMRPEVRSSG
jgi:hypothetical protein